MKIFFNGVCTEKLVIPCFLLHNWSITTQMKKNNVKESFWYPEKIIQPSELKEDYIIIILNTKIKLPPNYIKNLWQNAKYRITVDGGTNRWLYFLQKYCIDQNLKNPDYITGDFDSVTKEALEFFKNEKCKHVHTPNQNETDFTKALRILKPVLEEQKLKTLVVIQETSGRLDQIMANINTLFKAKSFLDESEIYLVSNCSLSWLLNPGKHSIFIPSSLVKNKRWCSFLPIGEESIVTTSGFQYNLDKQLTRFGDIVSSSNSYVSEILNVNTSGNLLWSMGVFNFDED